MNIIVSVVATLFLFLSASSAFPHAGALDSYGCHNNNKSNVYECHSGKFVGKSWSNPGGKDAMLAEIAAATPPVVIMGEATLTWAPPVDGVTSGYLVYWGLEPGKYQTPIEIGLVTELKLTGILKGATYYFALKAKDAKGNLSPLSNEVSKKF